MTKNLHIERITVDFEFERKTVPKLKEFYFTAVLPELASPQAITEPSQWVTNEWKKTLFIARFMLDYHCLNSTYLVIVHSC